MIVNIRKKIYEDVKKSVPHEVKKWLRIHYQSICNIKESSELRKTCGEKRIILIGTPEHGNLGDHGIVEAEIKILTDYMPAVRIVEVTGNYYRSHKAGIAKYINEKDKIIITGGGFLGSLWFLEENMVRDIIQTFTKNKIIIFPQTIYFDDNYNGKCELNTSKTIYQNHRNLLICLRDSASYDFVRNNLIGGYFSNCILVPDVVTYLNKIALGTTRNGILLCLREDKEKNITNNEKEKIEKYALQIEKNISYTSTVIPKKVTKATRSAELESKLNEFKSARLVITDRLHGMLFAAITATPCIALNNTSGKVKGVYQWIQHLDYISYIDSVDEIPNHIDRLISLENCRFDNSCLLQYFHILANVVQQDEY